MGDVGERQILRIEEIIPPKALPSVGWAEGRLEFTQVSI